MASGRGAAAQALAAFVVAAVVAAVVTWLVIKPDDDGLPPVPRVESVTELGPLRQHPRVNGRDNGQSAGFGSRSIWVFGDTVTREPWAFISSTGASTTDLLASDGITITSTDVFGTTGPVPTNMIPYTAAEKAFTAKHEKSRCTPEKDTNCGAQIGLWPGAIVADPGRDRVLVFYAKLCRGGPENSRCSGPLGHGLGTGIASLDMTTRKVTRLTAGGASPLPSVETDADPTLFFPYRTAYTAAATLVGDQLYVYGDCNSRCHLARVPIGAVSDRSRWEFFSGRAASGAAEWSKDYDDATTNLSAGSAGNSVIRVPALNAWLNVYLPPLSNTLTAQIGSSPAGPWSRAFALAATDNAGSGTNYAGFAHPEYAEDDGLVQYLSYYQASTYQQRLLRLVFDD
ncbi:DUF4185 domain-containing protein [Cryptosporangium arvum]|uniref:DUF4185 domain-containing protein n=1 Tax=Cryptosporangium arvum DSM 44712 TaxID=927661 RepID=A0A010Z0Y7_9ACTN|nr:DUF4185 domain-containing protein [Cryptosporangium arvum]EXG81103.1 hypothetical protein CryarDRAFT_2199 [Cryptosporangium arvum DSM 44712]